MAWSETGAAPHPIKERDEMSDEREKYALFADRVRKQLKNLERKRRYRGDEAGARRASVGAAVAARIANEIRCAAFPNQSPTAQEK
jgi:hypothetical protein